MMIIIGIIIGQVEWITIQENIINIIIIGIIIISIVSIGFITISIGFITISIGIPIMIIITTGPCSFV